MRFPGIIIIIDFADNFIKFTVELLHHFNSTQNHFYIEFQSDLLS